ncbi:MAG: ATP-dependent RecD-like DNA helicase [Oscillospiraceae bacterium]|nr:ATP-dependent RecD-like DNA helicase [Oscillospiraceae bacterium]
MNTLETAERLSGVVETVIFENTDTGYAVVEIASEEAGELVTAVGELAPVSEGEELDLWGAYTTHPQFGVQFKVKHCQYRLPNTQSAILQYLCSGILPGIGPITARRIVDAFGNDTFEVIDLFPEKLATIKGMTYTKACKASLEFKRIFGVREAIAVLAKLGLTAGQAIELYRHMGPATLTAVQDNPYILCGSPLYFPFEEADAIAQSMQLSLEAFSRIKAGIIYVLRHNLNNGHTCLPADKLVAATQRLTEVSAEPIEQCLNQTIEDSDLMRATYAQTDFIYLPEYFTAEIYIAYRIKNLMSMPLYKLEHADVKIDVLQAEDNIVYAPLQRKAIAEALTNNAFVLTGGPGTGKTTTVNAIIRLFEQNGDRVALAAPTGRAAKRLAELTGRKAQTIHRLLEVDYKSGTEQLRFVHNDSNLLKCDVVILDEMSMVDTTIFESLLHALKPACKLILVGDSDQLPSVGAGNILRGIADSGCVPVVCLKEIFRQAAQSLIVSNAHRIVGGEMPQNGTREDDYFFIEGSGAPCQKFICDLVTTRLPNTYKFSPLEDIQVLCPTKMGLLGTEMLNAALQAAINPPQKSKPQLTSMGQVYRLGDKVMQTKNNYDIPFVRDEGEDGAGAFNGDIGVVEQVDVKASTLKVRFDDRVYTYTSEFIKQLEIAYAVTIHKSQGSEFNAVIIPVAEVPRRLCYRNLLYTGVTRAKKLLVLCGSAATVHTMVQNDRKTLRYSCLKEFINDESFA